MDYEKTILATISFEDEPDSIVDLGDVLPKELSKWQFPRIVDAFCPFSLKYYKPTIKEEPIEGMLVDAALNRQYMRKMRTLLTNSGLFYESSVFDGKLLINKMFAYGFEFVRKEDLTFDKTSIQFHVYRKRSIPKLDELITFVTNNTKRFNIREIQIKYAESLEGEYEPYYTFLSILPSELESQRQFILELDKNSLFCIFI